MLSKKQLKQLRDQPADACGNRLGAAMRAAKLTQEQLEERSGVPQSTISRILTGDRPLTPIDTGHKLARVFECQIEDIFPAKDEALAS